MREKYIKLIKTYTIYQPPVNADNNIIYYDAIVL